MAAHRADLPPAVVVQALSGRCSVKWWELEAGPPLVTVARWEPQYLLVVWRCGGPGLGQKQKHLR